MSVAASPCTCTLIINTGCEFMTGSCPCLLVLSLIRPLFPSCLPLQNVFRVPRASLANVCSVSVIEERVEAVGLRFPSLSVHIKVSRLSKGIPSFSTPAKPATAPPVFISEGIFRSDPLWIYHICEDLEKLHWYSTKLPVKFAHSFPSCWASSASDRGASTHPIPPAASLTRSAQHIVPQCPRPTDRGAEKDLTVFQTLADSHTVHVCFQQMSRVNYPLVPTGDCWSEMTLAGEPGGPSEAYLLMLWHLEGYFLERCPHCHTVYFSLSTFHDHEHSTFCILGHDI